MMAGERLERQLEMERRSILGTQFGEMVRDKLPKGLSFIEFAEALWIAGLLACAHEGDDLEFISTHAAYVAYKELPG